MKYYTKDGVEHEYTMTSKINDTGRYGSIFRVRENDSICLKYLNEVKTSEPLTIFDDTPTVISEDIFGYFKGLNNPNFCKLYDLLYSRDGKIVAYTMRYYQNAIHNILLMPTDYLVDNFSAIYDAMDKLAKDLVMVVDLHNRNMVLTENDIVIVDFDKYRIEKDKPYDVILEINTSALYYAFSKMFNNALKECGLDVDNPTSRLRVSELFSYGTNPYVLKRKLDSCKRIGDYFLQ